VRVGCGTAVRKDLILARPGRGPSSSRIKRRGEAALSERVGGGWSERVATMIVPAPRSPRQSPSLAFAMRSAAGAMSQPQHDANRARRDRR
jgi:hypothetical protein